MANDPGRPPSVVVFRPSEGGPGSARLTLSPNESLRFGRASPDAEVELPLDDPAVPRLAGEILAVDDHWRLSNYSARQPYVVENPEGAGEYLRIAPLRAFAPIPFEFSRVVLPTRGTPVSFQVWAPAHVYVDAHELAGHREADPSTVAAFSLDRTATYFLVLLALCEPRLRDVSMVAVPTTRQVIERLRDHPRGHRLTASAVDFHIDYLATTKLGIKHSQDEGRLEGKREAVVFRAVRFGLVEEADLPRLDERA